MSSDRRVAVITGAASGIGAATAEALAAAGNFVVLLDRAEAVHKTLQKINGQSGRGEAHVVELTDFAAVRRLLDDIVARHGRLDVLVNNAGVHPKNNGARHTLDETDVDTWNFVLNVNLTAPFVLSQHVLPVMRKQKWGRIINIVSRAGRTYSAEAGAHYSASKAGLIGFTRSLAGEAGPFGITANCVAPGRVRTPLGDEGIGLQSHAKYSSQVPVGRVGTTTEIAAAVVYLASDQAAFTTGAVIDVNGGGFMA